MSRELNPDIFGAGTPKAAGTASTAASSKLSLDLIQEIVGLKKRVRDLEVKADSGERRVEDALRSVMARIDRFQSAAQRLDEYLKSTLHEMGSRVSTLAGKLTERKVSDTKVEDMIGRHNQIVHQFEMKMTQLQKLISEQEMKLMHYKSLVEEFRRQQR